MISIIAPCFNEVAYIENMVDSVAGQTIGQDAFEMIIIDGASTDGTRELLDRQAKKYGFLKIMDNPNRTVPYSMNIGIENSGGDYIARMDVHAIYPKNYLEVLLQLSRQTGAANVGCTVETLPANDTLKAKAIARVLASPFGVGNSYFRIGTNKVREVDTVPFGFFRKEIFDQIGLFDTDLLRNQDDELNGRICKVGKKILLTPRIRVSYFPRDSFFELAKMYYQYGLYKPLVNQKLGASATLRQFIPPILVLYLIAGAVFSLFVPKLAGLYLLGIGIYLLAAFAASIRYPLKANMVQTTKATLLGLIGFLTVHISYGSGYLIGLLAACSHK